VGLIYLRSEVVGKFVFEYICIFSMRLVNPSFLKFNEQDYGYYAGGQGGGGQAARGYQNAQRGNEFFGEPTTPQYGARPTNQRKNNDESEFSPGLLDLHSFDTELLPEVIGVLVHFY